MQKELYKIFYPNEPWWLRGLIEAKYRFVSLRSVRKFEPRRKHAFSKKYAYIDSNIPAVEYVSQWLYAVRLSVQKSNGSWRTIWIPNWTANQTAKDCSAKMVTDCSLVHSVLFSSHPVFKCSVPAENDNWKTELVRYLDPHCTLAVIKHVGVPPTC
jgi:hypothetical protein